MRSPRIFKNLKYSSPFLSNRAQLRNVSNSQIDADRPKFDQIQVTSTFNRQTKNIPNVCYVQRTNHPGSNLNLYCCGPTVYAHSHLGHAISYVRCDLVVRMFKIFANVNVYFAMNITDLDDKIINKANEMGVEFRELSNEYHRSFVEDMNELRVTRPDFTAKIVDNIDLIGDYVKQIYKKGFAYINSDTGDVNFNYEKFITNYCIQNEGNYGTNQPTSKSRGKHSPKDFVLWKVSKPGEPRWTLNLDPDTAIIGRPGWHVECSALSHRIFGPKLDIHFGGFDLIFPHHHCESCCSHVYRYQPGEPQAKQLYSTANVWLHSGHLILRSEKMSKSLGNVVLIKDFLKQYPTNILRLLCIHTPYRSEIDFDQKLLIEMEAYNAKLQELVQQLELAIYKLSSWSSSTNEAATNGHLLSDTEHPLAVHINQIEDNIWQGFLDDLNFNQGLEAFIDLARIFPKALPVWLHQDQSSKSSLLFQCIRLRTLMRRWCDATGLDYGLQKPMSHVDHVEFVEELASFRSTVRESALQIAQGLKRLPKSETEVVDLQRKIGRVLDSCDQIRTFLDKRGIKVKDPRLSSSQ